MMILYVLSVEKNTTPVCTFQEDVVPLLRNEENHSEDIFFIPNEPTTSPLEYSPEICQKLIGFSNRRVNTGMRIGLTGGLSAWR